jgi:hypothetical protein
MIRLFSGLILVVNGLETILGVRILPGHLMRQDLGVLRVHLRDKSGKIVKVLTPELLDRNAPNTGPISWWASRAAQLWIT